jgi:hypothetical protein
MGSTCPWEEIVDHVPQEKWEVEYKVYVTECSYSTRYFGSEDKQADTELPSPFHIDLDTNITTEDWATIENVVNSMVNVVVDTCVHACVPLSKVNLSSYGWPNVETPRSLGNGNCAMHAYLLALAGKQYYDHGLQVHNVQDGKKAMAEFFEICREHVVHKYKTTPLAEWPWARRNKRWACSNDQHYINEPESFDEYVRVLRDEPFWFSAFELQILATMSHRKQELFVCDEDGTRPRLIKKLSYFMRAIEEPMLDKRNLSLGDIMPHDLLLQYNGTDHYEVRAHKDDMVVDVPQQRIESIDLTHTHDALNKQRIVMRRLAVGSIIGNLDLCKGDVVKAPTEPRLYNHVAKLDGESIVCIVHSREFNNSYRLVGPDGMMESMFSRELLEPLQLPNRKWLNATLLETHWAMDEPALLTQWHRLQGVDVSNMKASSAGAQSSAISSTGGLKARRAITKGKKASKAMASCAPPKPLPVDTEAHHKTTACELYEECYKAKSYTVHGKPKPLPHSRNLLSKEFRQAIVVALMCEHDAKGKDVLEVNKARKQARKRMGQFAKKWKSILENYELQEDVGGPNPDVLMTKQKPITNTAGHKKRKSRDGDCGDVEEEDICREVVTTENVGDVLWEVHTYGGTHNLSEFMYDVARAKYFGITEHMCRAFCASCPCAKGTYAKPKKVHPGYNALKTTRCLERVQVDLIVLTSMRPDLNQGFQYILTVKDHFSGFVWLRPLKNKNVKNVNAHLLFIFGDNGAPMILQSDNGSEFKDMAMTTKQFAAWVKKAGLPAVKNVNALCHLMTSQSSGVGEELEDHFKATFPTTHMVFGRVKASSTQGSVERANQDVQRFLFYTMLYNEAQGKPRGVWFPYLMDVQRRMNYQKKKSRGGKSPHEIFFARDPLTSLQRFSNLSPSLQKELMGVWVDFASEH